MATETRTLQHEAEPAGRRRTIARLWQDAVARKLDSPAYLVQEGENWRPVSWAEADQAVDEIAHGLLALGVRKGDAFAILASTRLEWVLFDFALGLIGAVGAPIYMNNSPKDAQYVAGHSEAVGVLCEDDEQRAKLDELNLKHVLTFADLPALREQGRAHAAEHPNGGRGRPLLRSAKTISSRSSTRRARLVRRRPA